PASGGHDLAGRAEETNLSLPAGVIVARLPATDAVRVQERHAVHVEVSQLQPVAVVIVAGRPARWAGSGPAQLAVRAVKGDLGGVAVLVGLDGHAVEPLTREDGLVALVLVQRLDESAAVVVAHDDAVKPIPRLDRPALGVE